MTDSTVLRVSDVAVTFSRRGRRRSSGGVRALDGVSLELGRGETLGVVGESGSGKSTLARVVMRLLDADRGEVELDGVRIDQLSASELRQLRPQFQMVFQDPYSSLDSSMTVGESVAQPLVVHRTVPKSERSDVVAALLERVGLGRDYADRYPDELSGGQRQRVAIARALALGPKLIVCDESVSALDVSTQNQVINLFEDIQRDSETSYLFIAHDLSVVRHIAHRVIVMYLGRVVESGPIERVFSAPAHPYTEALLSAIPIPNPRLQRARTRITLEGDPPDPTVVPAGCSFHDRCRHVMPRCAVDVPALQEVDGGGSAACHLLDLDEPVRLAGLDPDETAVRPRSMRPPTS